MGVAAGLTSCGIECSYKSHFSSPLLPTTEAALTKFVLMAMTLDVTQSRWANSRGHKVQGKPEPVWSIFFPSPLSCSPCVPSPSPKGDNLICSWHHWYYWVRCSSWLFCGINVVPSDISPFVQGDFSVGIRNTSHIPCRIISYYMMSFLLSLYPSFLPYRFYSLYRFFCIQFEECLNLCRLRYQSKLRRPQRFLLTEDLGRKKNKINGLTLF